MDSRKHIIFNHWTPNLGSSCKISIRLFLRAFLSWFWFRFAKRPNQWKAQQATKERVRQDFQAIFGSKTKHQKGDASAHQFSESPRKKRKRHQEINEATFDDDAKSNATPSKQGFAGNKHVAKSGYSASGSADTNFIKNPAATSFVANSKKRKSTTNELADLASKKSLSQSDVQKLFETSTQNKGKHLESKKVPFLSRKQKKWSYHRWVKLKLILLVHNCSLWTRKILMLFLAVCMGLLMNLFLILFIHCRIASQVWECSSLDGYLSGSCLDVLLDGDLLTNNT